MWLKSFKCVAACMKYECNGAGKRAGVDKNGVVNYTRWLMAYELVQENNLIRKQSKIVQL